MDFDLILNQGFPDSRSIILDFKLTGQKIGLKNLSEPVKVEIILNP